MSLHRAHITWKRNTPDFAYETYDRTHTMKFEGGISIQGSSAPEFAGKAEYANPEEMLAAALSSCHMLTFLAVAAKSRLQVDKYEDEPVAELGKDAAGVMCVTKITLQPKVTFSGATIPDLAKVKELHDKAHKHCFIANSVKCGFALEPRS